MQSTKTQSVSMLILAVSALFLVMSLWVAAQRSTAQDTAPAEYVDAAVCGPPLRQLFTTASELCLGKPLNHICNGGWSPSAEPQGPVTHSLASQGALVPVDALTMINTPSFFNDGSHGGVAWMRVADTRMSALLLGDTQLREVPLDGDWPDWWSVIVQTSEEPPVCAAAPLSSLVVQSNIDFNRIEAMRMVMNGASIDLRGTIIVQTRSDETIFTAIEGEVRIIANGQTRGMVAGQQIRVAHPPGDFAQVIGYPGVPEPFERELLVNFPVELLDRPTILPEPGYVTTEGTVNMRAAPNLGGELLYQLPPGQIMTILGRNPAGDWYHVRLATGETGWMFADLLRKFHGELQNEYTSTPVPPQRFGEIGTQAIVSAPSGADMRSAPDASFQAIHRLQPATEVELVARSPYSPWVKVEAGDVVGWVALISLDTQSIVWSLPVDYDVPPQPRAVQPIATLVPGSWGGAFPNPLCPPPCNN